MIAAVQNRSIDLLAPLIPAAAAGYAGWQLAPFAILSAMPVAFAAALALYAVGFAIMRRSGEREVSAFQFLPFDLDHDDWIEDGVITDIPSLPAPPPPPRVERDIEEDVLLLEDAIGKADPDSRVVRLFDTQPAPTAGDLHQRIERHLGREPVPESQPAPPPESGDELKQAISDLREALRG